MNFCCQHLDDFFDDDLTSDQLSQFRESVADCESCSAAIQQQQLVDDKLIQAWDRVVVSQFDWRVELSNQAPKIEPITAAESLQNSNRIFWSWRFAAAILIIPMTLGVIWFLAAKSIGTPTKTTPPSWDSAENKSNSTKKEMDSIYRSPNQNKLVKSGGHGRSTNSKNSFPSAEVIGSSDRIMLPIQQSEAITIVRVYPTFSSD